MIIRTSRVKGEGATYKHVRGPDGSRFQAWKDGIGARALARFGLDTLIDGKPDPGVVRAMRNARKAERALAREARS